MDVDLAALPYFERHRQGWTTPDGDAVAPDDPFLFFAGGGNLALAVAVAAFLWPVFVEQDGVTLRGRGPHDVRPWLEAGHDLEAVEDVMNHAHLTDEFSATDLHPREPEDPDAPQNHDAGVPPEVAWELATVTARCWHAALSHAYPDRTFVVHAVDREDPQVSFHEDRDAPTGAPSSVVLSP